MGVEELYVLGAGVLAVNLIMEAWGAHASGGAVLVGVREGTLRGNWISN